MNESKNKLSVIIGNLEDKLEAIYRCPQPELTDLVTELMTYPASHKDQTKVSVIEVLYEAFKNPHLTEHNFNLIYPRVLNPQSFHYLEVWDKEISVHFKNHSFFTTEKKIEVAKFIYEQVVGKEFFLNPAEGFCKYLWEEAKTDKSLHSYFDSLLKQVITKMDSVSLSKLCKNQEKIIYFLDENKMYGVQNPQAVMDYGKQLLKNRKNKPSPELKKACEFMGQEVENIVILAKKMKNNRELMIENIEKGYASALEVERFNQEYRQLISLIKESLAKEQDLLK